jgi:hypothetical protein
MSIATAYAQKKLLSELSGVQGMAGGQGYFDLGAGWGEQPANYTATATWPAPTGTDPWGPPPVNPQNYSGGAVATGVPIYAAGPVPVAVPIPAYPPQNPSAPFDARNYMPPPDPPAGPFDAKNYVPPDFTPMQSTYEPRTSESAFNNSMLLHGGAITSPGPVVPPTYLYSPQLSSSRSGGSESYTSYTQSPSGLSRSASSRPRERETWLYDRPGTWRPRFQMPRSGVGSIIQNFSRAKNFPPGASYDFFFSILVLYKGNINICFFDGQWIRHRGQWTNAYASPPSGNHQSCGTCGRTILGSCSAN